MFNKYVVPDVEEEKARMRALVAKLEENSEEEKTDICPICLEEKSVNDLHRNCGK